MSRSGKNYLEAIEERLSEMKKKFFAKFSSSNEQQFKGLLTLINLSQNPNDTFIETAGVKLQEFIISTLEHQTRFKINL